MSDSVGPSSCLPVGKPGDVSSDYTVTSYKEATEKLKHFIHASHAMLYALDPTVVFDIYPVRAAVMMQMRFDGLLGFPGGLVDEGEDPVEGVNRELAEEIGLDLSRISFTEADHCVSYVHQGKQLVLHFFVKEIPLTEFQEIESAGVKSPDYGSEVLGLIRTPLYTMTDGELGLPTFLAQNFAGNGRDELIYALKQTKLLPEEYLDTALKTAQAFLKKRAENS